jgi:S1-C subfamily serine protease
VPELQEAVGRYRPGNRIKAIIRRGDKESELTLTLKDVSGSTSMASAGKKMKSAELGATFIPASASLLKKAGIASGLQIETLEEGILADAGLEEGFVLFKLDKKPIRSVQELNSVYKQGKGGLLLEALNQDGERQYFVLVRPTAP